MAGPVSTLFTHCFMLFNSISLFSLSYDNTEMEIRVHIIVDLLWIEISPSRIHSDRKSFWIPSMVFYYISIFQILTFKFSYCCYR